MKPRQFKVKELTDAERTKYGWWARPSGLGLTRRERREIMAARESGDKSSPEKKPVRPSPLSS